MSLAIGQSGTPLYRRWCTGLSMDGPTDVKQPTEGEFVELLKDVKKQTRSEIVDLRLVQAHLRNCGGTLCA